MLKTLQFPATYTLRENRSWHCSSERKIDIYAILNEGSLPPTHDRDNVGSSDVKSHLKSHIYDKFPIKYANKNS